LGLLIGAGTAAAEGTPAKVKGSIAHLPYSEALIEGNTYAVVWVLVDISAEGKTTTAKVLKAPKDDAELEQIALASAKKLRFEPARDEDGVAEASTMLVALQWAPFWASRTGKFVWAPCAGSGALPMDFGRTHEVAYRDCTPPEGYEKVDVLQRVGQKLYMLRSLPPDLDRSAGRR
jgi:TonB family protein